MIAFNLGPSALMHDPLIHDPLDVLLGAPLLYSRPLARCGLAPSLARNCITASVAEDENAYVVTVQAPGVKTDEVKISYEHEILTVASASGTAHGTLSFTRQAKLPNADAKSATAIHQDGVLKITLKKTPPSEPVRIPISTNLTDEDGDEDQHEDDDNACPKPYVLTVAAPGVKASDIQVEASHAALSIAGETSGAHGSFSIHRAYKLPRDADLTRATATSVDGILTIMLPTRPLPEATTIEIGTAVPVTKEAEHAGLAGDQVAESTAPAAQAAQAASLSETKVAAKALVAEAEAKECWLEEWDVLLDDLAEMGFEDRQSSRAALAKHSGSIKRAVKELVAGGAGM